MHKNSKNSLALPKILHTRSKWHKIMRGHVCSSSFNILLRYLNTHLCGCEFSARQSRKNSTTTLKNFQKQPIQLQKTCNAHSKYDKIVQESLAKVILSSNQPNSTKICYLAGFVTSRTYTTSNTSKCAKTVTAVSKTFSKKSWKLPVASLLAEKARWKNYYNPATVQKTRYRRLS